MIRKLRALLQCHQGKDVMALRGGPRNLYLWDKETQTHVRFDVEYRPEFPNKKDYSDHRSWKKALDARSTFLNRRKQAIRASF